MTNTGASLIDGVVFRPVRSGNALEDTVGRLMQTIRLGVVEPGNALPSERDLAARFSVSRDTVREAIRELSEAGYLVAKRGRYGGTFVADPLPAPSELVVVPSAADVEDLLGLRELLEVGAVRAASTRSLGAEERALLWTRLGEVQASSPEDYRRLDSRLHLAFAEIVGVPSLVTLLADNRSRVNELLDTFPLLARAIEHSNRQHEAIVFAILAGNEQGAAEAMHEHLDASAVLLRGFLA
jgi:GntR family transcriptional regulator, transcriptional repressor for pyruvate dehydrogenase complex